MESLAIKYRPHKFEDVVEQGSAVTILQNQLSTQTYKHCYLFCGPAGCGKAQPLYSKVLTPEGFIQMKDIKVGTPVFTDKGNITKVTGVFPQGSRDIYEITIQDGTKIRVADNHLNCVNRYNQDKKIKENFVVDTLQLIDLVKTSRFKIRVDTPCVNWDRQDVLIDPYLLGALIGDGSLSSGNFGFTNTEQDVVDKVNNLLKDNYGMYLDTRNNKDYSIKYLENPNHCGSRGDRGRHELVRNYDRLTMLKGQLEYYGLLCKSTQKHIPQEYLLNDYSTRLALLQGLYDTDGYTDKEGHTSFSTCSKQLSEDFEFLVRSLGIRDTVKKGKGRYKNAKGISIECNDCYTHYLHMPKNLKYCTSKKHLNRYKNRQKEPLRDIVNISYIGKEECQCIMVEHDDHTYISDGFIPTHNTTLARIFANELNENTGSIIELDAASNNGVDDVRRIIEQAQMKPLDSKYKVFIVDEVHALSNAGWQAFLKLIEEPPAHAIFLFCTTDPQKIPKTILSRVQRYQFQKISTEGIIDRLTYVLKAEGISLTHAGQKAVEYIARIADGGMRDSLTMLDQCLAYTEQITIESVMASLNLTDYATLIDLTDALLNRTDSNIIRIIEDVYNSGFDMKQFVKQYVEFMLNVCKYNITNDITYTQLPDTEDINMFLNNLNDDTKEQCLDILDIILQIDREIKFSTNPKVYIEAMLITGGQE